jgi:hypothetical protein
MYWFAIGAVCGVIHVWVWLKLRSREVPNPVPVILASAALGAATYGTVLWIFFSRGL